MILVSKNIKYRPMRRFMWTP